MNKTFLGITASLLLCTGISIAGPIVPNANASTAGNTDNRFPFLSGAMRYEQVFDASQFSGTMSIGQIDLRNGVLVDVPFSATISNIQISLSTVSLAPDSLSSTFASNLGADNTLVYNGSLTLSSTNAAGPGNTHVFDIVINLQTPFNYNPGLGNLLLDVKNISGANAFIGSDFFDAVSATGDSVSRVYGAEGSPDATTGTMDSLGLIAQFNTSSVPEPGALALVGLGLTGIVAWRRRRSNHT